jgi:beta-lactam-binding protein with PASTA domain
MSRLNKKFFSRLGIRKVDVPNLSGLARDQSMAVLNAVGLVPVDTPTNTENINLNLGIVSQSQAAGSTVLIGSQVSFNYYNYVAPPNLSLIHI